MSQWRELNPWPLPYQGSALPLSYIGSSIKKERETRFELATLSLEGWCSTNWATPAKWTTNVIHNNISIPINNDIMPHWYWLRWGEQDSNLRRRSHQIYSLTSLTAWVSPLKYFYVKNLKPMEGLEPTTCWLQISCSSQLSYIGNLPLLCRKGVQIYKKKQYILQSEEKN